MFFGVVVVWIEEVDVNRKESDEYRRTTKRGDGRNKGQSEAKESGL
jgi:hypothetical protein